jgi:hypothetical protein
VIYGALVPCGLNLEGGEHGGDRAVSVSPLFTTEPVALKLNRVVVILHTLNDEFWIIVRSSNDTAYTGQHTTICWISKFRPVGLASDTSTEEHGSP